jgi:hypothetical protein
MSKFSKFVRRHVWQESNTTIHNPHLDSPYQSAVSCWFPAHTSSSLTHTVQTSHSVYPMEGDVDVVVLGTGLTESITAS